MLQTMTLVSELSEQAIKAVPRVSPTPDNTAAPLHHQ